jgi:hypothetical protein
MTAADIRNLARGYVAIDYPYEIMQTAPSDDLAGLDLPEAAIASIAHGPARRFLGI